MLSPQSAAQLSNEKVLSEMKRLVGCEQAVTADIITLLAELDSRKLFFTLGYSSLFTYCLDELHLSEDATYTRIEVARISRAFPLVLELVRDGSLSLTNARLLAPVLTPENFKELLQAARHQRKRSVELLIARLRPQPDVPSVIRKLPTPKSPAALEFSGATTGTSDAISAPGPMAAAAPARRPLVAPLTPERFKIQFTADAETHALLRRAQALARHRVPSGDVALILRLALKSLVADLERTKAGLVPKPRRCKPPRPGSRGIPRDVKRAVWQRDDAQCAFEGSRGRCPERDFLEFHHVRPFAHGGATSVDNLELRCRAHNVYEAQRMLAD